MPTLNTKVSRSLYRRRNYSPAFKAKAAPAVLSGHKIVAQLSSEYGVHLKKTLGIGDREDRRRQACGANMVKCSIKCPVIP